VVFQFDDSLSPGKTLLFANKPEAFRIGPQLGLYLEPAPDVKYLDRLLLNLVYHPYYDVYSGRPEHWFQGNVTYNLDQSGMLGITFAYQRGADENTGKQTDLYKVTLSGKLDYCTADCPDKQANGSN
jgi:hypothetical protein